MPVLTIKQHFPAPKTYIARDPNNSVVEGDIVRITSPHLQSHPPRRNIHRRALWRTRRKPTTSPLPSTIRRTTRQRAIIEGRKGSGAGKTDEHPEIGAGKEAGLKNTNS